ncbi:MAG: DUF1501 domain-containing protein [Planctomycetaceae bacterium]
MTVPNVHRRRMLIASTFGLAGVATFGSGLRLRADDANEVMESGSSTGGQVESTRTIGGKAKSTILFFLCGGASHVDTWDMKPQAPLEYRGPFQTIETSAPGIQLCEHLPRLAQQAHHLALVRSIDGKVNTNDHHAGYYHNLTGHVPDVTFLTQGNNRTPYPDDWPFIGSVVASKRARHPTLPSAITLPHMPSRAPYTRPGQFSARLGVEHDPLYVMGSDEQPMTFRAPSLELLQGTDGARIDARRQLLQSVEAAARDFDRVADAAQWTRQQERAFSLLVSSKTTSAFDVSQEPVEVRQRYGETINGMSLLAARRLVEAGVPFVTVFWLGKGINSPLAKKCRSGGSWDTHGNNFACLKEDLLPEFDRAFSALIEDLAIRGMLDETLVMVTSEMGRKPKIGDPRSGGETGAGRDHWTHCLTDLLAGGGIQGGHPYGSSDRYGEYPAENPTTPADVASTVYHAMGVTDLMTTDKQGRPYHLLPDGKPLLSLF